MLQLTLEIYLRKQSKVAWPLIKMLSSPSQPWQWTILSFKKRVSSQKRASSLGPKRFSLIKLLIWCRIKGIITGYLCRCLKLMRMGQLKMMNQYRSRFRVIYQTVARINLSKIVKFCNVPQIQQMDLFP